MDRREFHVAALNRVVCDYPRSVHGKLTLATSTRRRSNEFGVSHCLICACAGSSELDIRVDGQRNRAMWRLASSVWSDRIRTGLTSHEGWARAGLVWVINGGRRIELHRE